MIHQQNGQTTRLHHNQKHQKVMADDQRLTSLLHEKDRLLLCHNQLVNDINKECAHKVDQLLQCKQQSINELQNNLVSSLTAINHDIMAVLVLMTGKNMNTNGITIADSLSTFSTSYSPQNSNRNSNIHPSNMVPQPPSQAHSNGTMYFGTNSTIDEDDNDSKMWDFEQSWKNNEKNIFMPDFSTFPVMHISSIPTTNPILSPTSIPTSIPKLISNTDSNPKSFPILTSTVPTSFPTFNSSTIKSSPTLLPTSATTADEKMVVDTKKENDEKGQKMEPPVLVVKEELHVNICNNNNMQIVDSVQCNLCHRSFDNSTNLGKHLAADHLFSCGLCHKSFAKKVDLSRHMRLHSSDPNEKVFECQICFKTYRSTGALHNHLRVHNMNKSANMHLAQTFDLVLPESHRLFECDVCHKGFTQVHHLKRHKRIHTGEQPFFCVVCKKRFKYDTSCRRHQKNVHQMELRNSIGRDRNS